jgi:hypothetical protein
MKDKKWHKSITRMKRRTPLVFAFSSLNRFDDQTQHQGNNNHNINSNLDGSCDDEKSYRSGLARVTLE